MRCPSCSKFATYDTSSDPELDLTLDDFEYGETDGMPDQTFGSVKVSGTARIVLTAECCGDELKEASFDVDLDIEVERSPDCTCPPFEDNSFDIRSESGSLTESRTTKSTRTLKDGTVKTKPIPPRFQKQFYGVEVEVEVACGCGRTTGTEIFKDEIQASSMDELV